MQWIHVEKPNNHGDMMRTNYTALVMVLAVSGVAGAQISTPIYQPAQDNGQMTWQSVMLGSSFCYGACSEQFVTQLGTGYSLESAAVFIKSYTIGFADPGNSRLDRIELRLEVDDYDESTGALTYTVFANLSDKDNPGRLFLWDVFFTVIVGDDSDVVARSYSVDQFASCNSDSVCVDSTTVLSSVTVGDNVDFVGAFLRGINIHVGDRELTDQFKRVVADLGGYAQNGDDAVGAARCGLLTSQDWGYQAEDIDCQLEVATLSIVRDPNFGVPHVFPVTTGDFAQISWPTHYQLDVSCSAPSVIAYDSFEGIISFDIETDSMEFGSISTGFAYSTLTPDPVIGNNQLTTFVFHSFADSYWNWPLYKSDVKMFIGFVY